MHLCYKQSNSDSFECRDGRRRDKEDGIVYNFNNQLFKIQLSRRRPRIFNFKTANSRRDFSRDKHSICKTRCNFAATVTLHRELIKWIPRSSCKRWPVSHE